MLPILFDLNKSKEKYNFLERLLCPFVQVAHEGGKLVAGREIVDFFPKSGRKLFYGVYTVLNVLDDSCFLVEQLILGGFHRESDFEAEGTYFTLQPQDSGGVAANNIILLFDFGLQCQQSSIFESQFLQLCRQLPELLLLSHLPLLGVLHLQLDQFVVFLHFGIGFLQCRILLNNWRQLSQFFLALQQSAVNFFQLLLQG